MRSAQELEAELVRTRRRLYRLTGWMTLAFIACLGVVFAAVGGALIVVDKRATNMLGANAGQTREAANARAHATPPAPAPSAPIAGNAAIHAGAAARTTVAAAPARPQAPPPETLGSASAPMPLAAQVEPPAPPATGAVAVKPAPAQAAEVTPPPQAKPPRPTDAKRTAHARMKIDARERAGTDARERAARRGDMRPGDDDAAALDDGGARRVIVLGPPRYARPADDRNDAGEPPRQHDLFHDLFGIFGVRGDQ